MLKLGIYQHYKGEHYNIIGVASHSETGESLVIYQALYGSYGLWARPVSMFTSSINLDNKEIKRFKFISSGVQNPPKFI